MPLIVNPKLNLANPEACPSLKVAPDNVVVLEIDNLLHGWPTYVLNYTPDRPGPVKFILRLRDVKKFVYIDSDSEGSEDEGFFKTAPRLDKASEDAATITTDLTELTQQTNLDAKIARVDAIPVNLYGTLPEDPKVLAVHKQVINEDEHVTWPPAWPRSAFQEVSMNRPTRAFTALKTTPALIRAANEAM